MEKQYSLYKFIILNSKLFNDIRVHLSKDVVASLINLATIARHSLCSYEKPSKRE